MSYSVLGVGDFGFTKPSWSVALVVGADVRPVASRVWIFSRDLVALVSSLFDQSGGAASLMLGGLPA